MLEKLTSPRVIRDILDRFELKAKKSYGQNFLIDENTLLKIAGAASIAPSDLVIEVGPGLGTLTRVLAERAGAVAAFESDRELLPVLAHTLADFAGKVRVVAGDFLQADLQAWYVEQPRGPLKVVANLPYYITTPIMFHLFESRLPIECAVFLVQREVARRIVAGPGSKEYGALSVAIQYRSRPEIVADVPPTVFYPAPKVTSTILRLNMSAAPAVQVCDERLFFRVVRAGFSQRRKTIVNALQGSSIAPIERSAWNDIMSSCGINPQARAEQLSIFQFAALADAVAPLVG